MARLVYLVRHGTIAPPASRRFHGTTDLPLDAQGEAQARRLAKLLAPLQPERGWVSPLRRARQTASLALPAMAPACTELPALREIDFGAWEGLTWDEAAAADPTAAAAWQADEAAFTFPGGESIADFRQRVIAAGRLLAEAAAERVVAFTHGGVIRTLICHYLGLDLANYLLFAVPCGSVTTIELFGERGVLRAIVPVDPEAAP